MQPAAQENNNLNRAPITAFVVCFNEQEHIEACLGSISFCDEILVIDSFSTDQTVDIARRCGARVIQREWPGYREQKAFGLSVSSNEWVLNIDADERVSEQLKNSILVVLQKEGGQVGSQSASTADMSPVNGYYINRVVHYLGRWWRQGGWYPEYRLRFFRKSQTVWGGADPHEKPIVEGRTERIDGELHHYTYRDMDEQFERLHAFSTLAAKDDYSRGKRVSLFSLLLNPIVRTLKFFIIKRGFREGTAGFIVAVSEGYYTFMKYAKLWEHEFNESEKKREVSTQGDKKSVQN